MKSLPMTNSFSFERFKQVLHRTLVLNKKQIILGAVGGIVGLFVYWCILMLFDSDGGAREKTVIMLSTGTVLYQIAGFIFTASIFNELHKNDTAFRFLTLPATTTEKLASGWVVTYLLYTIGALSILTLNLFFSNLAGQMFFNSDPLNMASLTNIYLNSVLLFYLLFNSVFLLGAALFRQYNFLKTAFSIVLFFIGAVLLSGIISFIYGPINLHFFYPAFMGLTSNSEVNRLIFELTSVIPPTVFFLTLSYYRLKNRQVA
ncbi:MAG: hypothetical protein GVY08_08565 [Bacteroidetes bacterium]|jgi:hypothetical protein|nr:hypothetical protein [Bacteroidota bacterium]